MLVGRVVVVVVVVVAVVVVVVVVFAVVFVVAVVAAAVVIMWRMRCRGGPRIRCWSLGTCGRTPSAFGPGSAKPP
jgi:hypothetical protein